MQDTKTDICNKKKPVYYILEGSYINQPTKIKVSYTLRTRTHKEHKKKSPALQQSVNDDTYTIENSQWKTISDMLLELLNIFIDIHITVLYIEVFSQCPFYF